MIGGYVIKVSSIVKENGSSFYVETWDNGEVITAQDIRNARFFKFEDSARKECIYAGGLAQINEDFRDKIFFTVQYSIVP
jgi:hypothetical protein